MTSHSKSLGGGKAAGGFGFSVAGDRKRKRLAEYPCVSRLRQRRLLLFLISHDFVQTHKAFVGETAVLMNVMHLQHLVSHGQWSDAVEYLSRFLPSDRPLGVHGRALLHFLRVHKAIDDIVAGARESLSVVAAVTMCSDRFVTSNPALTKLRAIFSSLIESKTPRDSVDLVSVRREASLVIHELVYRTPELKDYMRPCHGSTNPQNVLPLGFGHASFRPRRHAKKQGGQVPASVVAGIYLQKKKMLPSSPSSDHSHGFTREALVRAKEWLVDLVDKSVEAGKPRLRDPVRSACTQGAPGPQTTSCTVPRLGGKSRTRLLTDLVLLREAKEWLLYLTEDRLEAWPDASQQYKLQYSSKSGAFASRLSKTVPSAFTRSSESSSILSYTEVLSEAGVGNLSIR
ncbi:uncharacterized protein [Lolium perenne]|uniref:uncharacterized protein n=1 Tax=Lolium perenne TaxID=4522 RepID=UPI0021F690C4|nr:uncharacterized protein LOC127335409 [Lolium perenne]